MAENIWGKNVRKRITCSYVNGTNAHECLLRARLVVVVTERSRGIRKHHASDFTLG